MKDLKTFGTIVIVVLFGLISGQAQETKAKLKTYLIERDIPKAGEFTEEELVGISKKSCSVLEKMTDIEWVNSYVMDEKVYCLYRATTPKLIYQHAEDAGFPVTRIMEIGSVIGPKTAN
ncbi:MAG: DUF4242 domain-containing protein [Muricauda sp.]|nr:DUF4242 domain-containing protein [Allomuricauda sp.]MBA4745855.1 DUF4242 domain-containing protein [Allomuricauda sp.]